MTFSDALGGLSLVRQAMQAVTDHIRAHGLRVGDSLPGEAYFAAELGVSRPVMREAFGALAALRLLDVGNGRKARVGAFDGTVIAASLDHAVMTSQVSVAEVWEVRRTIELRTVELAAQARTSLEAREILSLADDLEHQADDLTHTTQIDIAFHQAVARASHNALFINIVNSFRPLMETAVPIAWNTRTTMTQRRNMVVRHQAVARAIAERDSAAAVQAMEGHFDTAIGDILKADFESAKGWLS